MASNVIKSRYVGNANITHCTQANVTDDQGLIEMLNHNAGLFSRQTCQPPRKSPCPLDHAYHPDQIWAALQALYPQIMTKIRFELAPKPTLAEKAAQGKTGFVPVATRWIIEGSNAWMERCKRRVKNSEAHLKSCDGKAQFVFHPIDVEAIVQWMRSQMGSIKSIQYSSIFILLNSSNEKNESTKNRLYSVRDSFKGSSTAGGGFAI